MDITETLTPKSDQLNAEDLLTGSRTVTVEKVTKGSVEQPVDIHLVEFPGRPFRPSKTVRRIIVAAWGAETSAYTGRRMTLYRDPDVKFGGMDVGGIRVSHLSNITKRLQIALTTTRGKRAPFVVDPLPDEPRATQQETPAEPGTFSKAARTKWLDSMFASLDEANTKDHGEQLAVIKTILGHDQHLENRDAINDVDLRTVVTTLGEWKKAGELVDKVADLLDMAAIAAESEGQATMDDAK